MDMGIMSLILFDELDGIGQLKSLLKKKKKDNLVGLLLEKKRSEQNNPSKLGLMVSNKKAIEDPTFPRHTSAPQRLSPASAVDFYFLRHNNKFCQ
jgi:hypothetical protein